MSEGIRSLVCISDLHCGCQLGLCPPEGVPLDGTSAYRPNRVQEIVWEWWTEFWAAFVPQVTHGEPYDILVNGDWIDNEHHGTKTLITNNITIQKRIAKRVMESPVNRCRQMGGRLYVVRGTEAHDGGAGQEVEDIAEYFDAVRDEEGRWSRWELYKRVPGPNPHLLVHATHHIGGSSSMAYETSAPMRELMSSWAAAAQTRSDPPLFLVRAHVHNYTAPPKMTEWGEAKSIVLPAWQAKSGYAFRSAKARNSPPEFGGVVIRNGDEVAYHRVFWRGMTRPREEV